LVATPPDAASPEKEPEQTNALILAHEDKKSQQDLFATGEEVPPKPRSSQKVPDESEPCELVQNKVSIRRAETLPSSAIVRDRPDSGDAELMYDIRKDRKLHPSAFASGPPESKQLASVETGLGLKNVPTESDQVQAEPHSFNLAKKSPGLESNTVSPTGTSTTLVNTSTTLSEEFAISASGKTADRTAAETPERRKIVPPDNANFEVVVKRSRTFGVRGWKKGFNVKILRIWNSPALALFKNQNRIPREIPPQPEVQDPDMDSKAVTSFRENVRRTWTNRRNSSLF